MSLRLSRLRRARHQPVASLGRLAVAGLAFILILSPLGSAQSRPGCSKPRVYVRVAFVKGVEEQLNRDYAFNTNEGWLARIASTVARELRSCAGDVAVVPLEQAVFIDDKPETPKEENAFNERVGGEYHLDFILGVADTRDARLARDGSLRPSYWSLASIGDADIDGRYVAVASAEYPDVDASINRAMASVCAGTLRSVIDNYEATHFFSLRDPTLALSALTPGFVSPEPDEQKIRIRVKTRDCQDRSGEGTNLWFPAENARGEMTAVWGTTSWQWRLGNQWRARTAQDGGIEIEYRLKRGATATRESIDVEVAGRGQKRTSQRVFFPAKTLRVEVDPEQNRVAPGESTRVVVRLLKVDEQGQREPVAGRRVTIKASGLKDGTLRPRDQVTTDQNGLGTLTYTAGEGDKRVHIEASYRPDGYETTFTGDADLNSGAYTVTVDLEFTSPYVPDGRMAIAALAMHVVFDEVFFERGSPGDPLSSLGDIDASEGLGTFKKFELQDSWTWGPATNRERQKFIKGKEPPKSFSARLTMATDFEALAQKSRTAQDAQRVPPDKARLVFATTMGRTAPWFGNSQGGGPLEEFELTFDVPWRDLLTGKPVTLKLPYQGEWPEEKGYWTISFIPKR